MSDELLEAVAARLGVEAPGIPRAPYVALAGEVGRGTRLRVAGDRPFRRQVALGPHRLDIRIESWLPTDTIRRAGFGHVVADRRHLLTLDRGLSFVSIARDGGAGLRTWEAGSWHHRDGTSSGELRTEN